MYFHDRAEAGRMIAEKLAKYKKENIIVVALDPSSAVVAAQVAMKLHSSMALYVIESIMLPGETKALAGMGSGDIFTYNHDYSAGELEEFNMEYHQYIEQARMEKSHVLHALLGHEGEISKDMLRHRTIIVVSDGLSDGFKLNVVADYLKRVAIKRLVIATPLASTEAIDRMHMIGDEILILSPVANYVNTDHYYDSNILPDIDGVIKMMRNISYNWDRSPEK